MRSTNGNTKRMLTAIAVAAALVFTASGAGAAAPAPLRGQADAQALTIRLQLPSIDQLKATLKAAGVDLSAVPNLDGLTGFKGLDVSQTISWTSATSQDGKGVGFAAPLAGLITVGKTEVKCDRPTCSDQQQSSGVKVPLLANIAGLGENGIGVVEIAGATSKATSPRDIENNAAMVRVNVSLAELIGKDGQLALLGQVLDLLTDTVNDNVVDTANAALGTVNGILDNTPAGAVKDALEPYITQGEIKRLNKLTEVDLFNVTVLGSQSDVTRQANGTLTAIGESKVADVRVLGDWLTIDSISATAKSYIDLNVSEKAGKLSGQLQGSPAQADKAAKDLLARLPIDAIKTLKFTGADLGGLLKLHTPELLLLDDLGYNRIRKALKDTAPAGLESAVDEVIATLDLLYNTAGVKLEVIKGFTNKPTSARGTSTSSTTRQGSTTITEQTGEASLNLAAAAKSDYLRLTVAPAIPLVTSHTPGVGGIVPRLTDDQYVPTGVKLTVDFPQASSSVAQGAAVLGTHFLSRTGIGTPWIVALAMIGAAVGVRRFVLAR